MRIIFTSVYFWNCILEKTNSDNRSQGQEFTFEKNEPKSTGNAVGQSSTWRHKWNFTGISGAVRTFKPWEKELHQAWMFITRSGLGQIRKSMTQHTCFNEFHQLFSFGIRMYGQKFTWPSNTSLMQMFTQSLQLNRNCRRLAHIAFQPLSQQDLTVEEGCWIKSSTSSIRSSFAIPSAQGETSSSPPLLQDGYYHEVRDRLLYYNIHFFILRKLHGALHGSEAGSVIHSFKGKSLIPRSRRLRWRSPTADGFYNWSHKFIKRPNNGLRCHRTISVHAAKRVWRQEGEFRSVHLQVESVPLPHGCRVRATP